MSAKDYHKPDAVAFGDAVGNLINAVRKDGVSTSVFDEILDTVRASGSVVNEMKDVPEAAIEHTVGAALDTLGDHAQAKALAEEAEAVDPPG